VIVNLNNPLPPPGAEPPEGPLFAEIAETLPDEQTALDDLLDYCLQSGLPDGRLRIDWHLSERDFPPQADGPRRQRLLRVAKAALEGGSIAFTMHRPRRPVLLGPALDRRHPAVLLVVGLHLPRLVDLPGVHNDPELFLSKLASLARLALSAAVQKRAALRRHSRESSTALGCGFLLERARLLVAPIGLEAAVRTLLGRGLCEDKQGLAFARGLVVRLRDVLAEGGRGALVESCLETPWEFRLDGATPIEPGEDMAGVTPWDPAAAPRSQLRAAGILHGAAGSGTAALLLPRDQPVSADEMLSLLEHAWRQTDVMRLRLVRSGQRHQASLPGL
jgi:hypothetical protein